MEYRNKVMQQLLQLVQNIYDASVLYSSKVLDAAWYNFKLAARYYATIINLFFT